MGLTSLGSEIMELFKHEGEEHWERLERILDITAEEWDAELKELNYGKKRAK